MLYSLFFCTSSQVQRYNLNSRNKLQGAYVYCSTCKVESGPTLFCHVCDNYLPNPATGLKAGLARRFMAVILDDVLAIVLIVLSVRWLIAVDWSGSSFEIVIGLVSALALITYQVAFFVALSVGMTPGKWILGIRVVDKRNGAIPGLGRMFVREVVGKIISGFFAGLGFFWAIWDRDSQAWHDKIAGTVVVRRDVTLTANQPSGVWPSVACFALFMLLCLQTYSAMAPSWSRDTSQPTDNEALRQSDQPGQTVSESASPSLSNQSEGPVVSEASTQDSISSTATGESTPIAKYTLNVTPIDISPSSTQDPMESKRLNSEGLHMLSGGNPDFTSARGDFERAFQLDSTNVEALNNLGYVYGRLGDYHTAESTLLKVLDMSPTRTVAQGNLGDVQAELGKTQEAANHFCQYIRQFDSLEHGKSTLMRVFKDSDPNVQAAINMTLANCN